MKDIFKSKITPILPGLAVALFGCLLLFIYAPYELYLTNSDEFWFSASQMLPVALAMFLVGFAGCAVLFFLARCINPKLYYLVFSLGLLAALACYVQGSFLVSNLPPLDGVNINWTSYPAERTKTLLLWSVLAVLIVLLSKFLGSKRLERYSSVLCLCLSFVLVFTLSTLAFTTDIDKKGYHTVTDEDLFLMSEEENFIIFLLDMTPSRDFKLMLESKPEYRDIFNDFTYYENTLGGYMATRESIPLILTGQWYECEPDYNAFLSESIENSSFFNYLSENDYVQNVYLDFPLVAQSFDTERFSNVDTVDIKSDSQLFMAKLILKMSLIKHAPWDLKYLGYDLYNILGEHRVFSDDDDLQVFNNRNSAFYSAVKGSNPITTTQEKCFKYIHLEGNHYPYHYNTDLSETSEGSFMLTLESCFTMIKPYFEHLKESGVWDNSVIIVLADHGSTDGSPIQPFNQNPMFMIKGLGEQHEIQYSDAPISYDDLQQAYIKLAGGAMSDEVFDWNEGDDRERRFIWVRATDHAVGKELIHTGHASDSSSMVETGVEYPK